MQKHPEILLREMSKNKKVLILGGLGFIGSNITISQLGLNNEVRVYDNLDPHSGGKLCNLQDFNENCSIYFHDILDFDRLVEHISWADVVINCAASTSHSYSMREPFFDLDVNIKGVLNILEAIKRFNPNCKFIHLGTTTQLGPLSYEPADELHPEFPTDIYSANKSVSEKYVLIYAKAHNLNCTVLRLSNVYGPRASIHTPELTFNNYFIGLALRNKPITIYGDGLQLRNLIHVDDVCSAIELACIDKTSKGQTYFIVSDRHMSVKEIASIIIKEANSGEIQLIDWPKGRKATEVGNAIISNSKAKQQLKWTEKVKFEDGIINVLSFYRSKLKDYLI